MICATCGADGDPQAQWQALVICGNCGETLVLADDGTTRKAMADDTVTLPPEALAHLRLGRQGFRSMRQQR